jgi:hypothetical protein
MFEADSSVIVGHDSRARSQADLVSGDDALEPHPGRKEVSAELSCGWHGPISFPAVSRLSGFFGVVFD